MTTKTTAPRPRIIERWFPCAEVSAASGKGWGSSNSEILLMSWFAKRPLAQSRAATLCSLLPWPDDADEQERVKAIIREALGTCTDPDWAKESRKPHAYGIVDCARHDPTGGYNAARTDALQLLANSYPGGAATLDPFSGRGLIPVESARYGVTAHAIDYSPVAALASRLLIDYPFRNWDDEPDLPFDGYDSHPWKSGREHRLVHDIDFIHAEVQRRVADAMDPYYPDNARGDKPWGYLWAATIPCNECGRWFPLYGSNVLRKPNRKGNDPGQSFDLHTNGDSWAINVVSGISEQMPTMHAQKGKRGKLAWCPFRGCGHAHQKEEHKTLVQQHYGHEALLAVADLHGTQKVFRAPTEDELAAPDKAHGELVAMKINGMPARPDECIQEGEADTVRAGGYGAKDFGDLSNDRQNLLHAHLAQAISDTASQMQAAGASHEYARALAGYCSATVARKLKRSTRGARLQTTGGTRVGDIFVTESAIAFNYDYFEAGPQDGPGTWLSVAGPPSMLEIMCATHGEFGRVQRASALSLPMGDGVLDAVITDPPYDMMIDYTDASNLFWVWMRRALAGVDFDFAMTAHPEGRQETAEEIIVKRHYQSLNDHRDRDHYSTLIARAFAEARRVVHDDGVVSIVFGHGDIDVWDSLLTSISEAGLVLTGAWPANTEKGGPAGSANINTTLTLACRPAPADRPVGNVAAVEAEIRSLIRERVETLWNPSQLSFNDQKMAAHGPAMEVVGHYSQVLDKKGRPVPLDRFLLVARDAVVEAWDMRFDDNPLEVFDRRTRFALEWVRSSGRSVEAASEARWQQMAADLDDRDVEGLLVKADKGVRLGYSSETTLPTPEPGGQSAFIDVALAAAAGWRTGGIRDAAAAIRDSGHDPDEGRLWAVISGLSQNLPETDEDGQVWTQMVRTRDSVVLAVRNAEAAARIAAEEAASEAAEREASPALFEHDNLFAQED